MSDFFQRRREAREARVAKAVEMRLQGASMEDIAAALFVHLATVYDYLRDHPQLAGNPPSRSLNTRLRNNEFVLGGGMFDFLRSLPPDTAEWLIANVPPGGTVLDLLRAITVDTHADDTDAEETP